MIRKDATYSFDLSVFLNRLRQEDFSIGIDTHLQVQKILKTLDSDFEESELLALLMPLICKSPKQQLTFRLIFKQFWVSSELAAAKKAMQANTAISEFSSALDNPKETRLDQLYRLWEHYKKIWKAWWTSKKEQKTVAEHKRGITPDKYRDLYAETAPITLSEVMTSTVARLRTRESLGVQKIDIEKTIEQSIKSIGTFTPVYTNYTRYTEYLILIQADNPNDHKARLYNCFYEEMEYRNIPVQRYFFRTNPLSCYHENNATTIELADLIRQQSNALLIVFANLHTFLVPNQKKAFGWTEELKVFPYRALFLPFGSTIEAHLAQTLWQVFDSILPATNAGFEAFEEHLSTATDINLISDFTTIWQPIPTFPIPIESEEDITGLVELLPPHLLKWIAACAIYPDFSWKMTLFLGETLATDTQVYNTWENIRQLARVSCFKEAYMPQYIRRYILEGTSWLKAEDITAIKARIYQLMSQNKANNFSGDFEDFLSRIYLEPKDKQAKDFLSEHLKEEVDYTTASLIEDSRFKDVLLFDLEAEILEKEEAVIDSEVTLVKQGLADLSEEAEVAIDSEMELLEGEEEFIGSHITDLPSTSKKQSPKYQRESKVDIVILTSTEIQYKTVSAYLEDTKPYSELINLKCILGNFQGNLQFYKILVCQTGFEGTKMALAAKDIADKIKPSFIFTVGIAGGVNDVVIGDVVVATRAYGYESGKITDAGFMNRPTVYHFDDELIAVAETMARTATWTTKLAASTKPKVFFGPIASGDKVITSIKSEAYQQLKKYYNDTLALEMEAAGFAEAMYSYRRTIRTMNIRAISDLLDNKSASDKEDTQEKAAAHAAAFTFELLAQLDFDKYNLQMDNKLIAQEVVEQLLPLLDLKENLLFKPTSNTSANALWKQVETIFLEEIKDNNHAAELKGALKSALRKKLKTDQAFGVTLERLVRSLKESPSAQQPTIIENSKNVVSNSSIKAGGNVIIGDNNGNTTTTNYNNTTNIEKQIIHITQVLQEDDQKLKDIPKDDFETKIQILLAEDKFKTALEQVLQYTKGRDKELHNHTILISGQWNGLQKDIHKGIIGLADRKVQEAKIRHAMLYILDEL